MKEDDLISQAIKDKQTTNSEWEFLGQKLIDGVQIKEVKNMPKDNGYLTEIFRTAWNLDELRLNHVFQVVINPGCISAWHAHKVATDRLFVNIGMMRIALYDGRESSPTNGVVNEFKFGSVRPALLIVPPEVWHGVQNIASSQSAILNLCDHAYSYEDPDHWRLPHDAADIPFSFSD